MKNQFEFTQEKDAVLRTVIDKAIAYGRKRKSAQSGFIHFCYGVAEEGIHHTIPTLDNFLYALALLRSRTVENVLEAKEIVEKLLHFQINSGAFPIYLHDYPVCKERYLAVNIGLILCRMLKEFAPVLGAEMRQQLLGSLKRVVAHIEDVCQTATPPYGISVAIAVMYLEAGLLIEDSHFQKLGESLMNAIDKKADHPEWLSPKSLGFLLNCLSLAYPALVESPWKVLVPFLGMVWHSKLSTYVGPPYQVFQFRNEPQVTLFDFYMGGFDGVLSKRALRESHVHLEAAMVYLTQDVIPVTSYPDHFGGVSVGVPCMLAKDESAAYTCFQGKPTTLMSNQEKGFHPLMFFWGDRDSIHTIDIQRVRVGPIECTIIKDGIEMLFTLDAESCEEDKERNREIIVAVDRFDGSSFSVDGHLSSIFHLSQELVIDARYSLKFELREGEGKFLGHRMPGNRFSQIGIGESNRHEAYDWLVFLRSVNRQDPCKIALTIKKL